MLGLDHGHYISTNIVITNINMIMKLNNDSDKGLVWIGSALCVFAHSKSLKPTHTTTLKRKSLSR